MTISAAAEQRLVTWAAMDAVRWSEARMGDFSSPCVGKTRVLIDGPPHRLDDASNSQAALWAEIDADRY